MEIMHAQPYVEYNGRTCLRLDQSVSDDQSDCDAHDYGVPHVSAATKRDRLGIGWANASTIAKLMRKSEGGEADSDADSDDDTSNGKRCLFLTCKERFVTMGAA